MRFLQTPYCRFLSNKYFERSPYFTLLECITKNNANAKFQKIYRILYLYILEKLLQLTFFMITFFTLFLFLTVHTFLYKTLSFFEKLKTSLKACFYIILQNFYKQLFCLQRSLEKVSFFYKVRTKLHIKIIQHDDAYFNVLIQRKHRNTKKLVF